MEGSLVEYLPALVIAGGAVTCAIGAFWKERRATPALVVLAGALASALGGIWVSCNRAEFEKEQRIRLEEVISSVTGGESSVFIMVGEEHGKARVRVANLGPYPLYDVSIRTSLMRGLHAFQIEPKQAFKGAVQEDVNLGNMAPHVWRSLGSLQLPHGDTARFDFTVMARNGYWRHFVTLRKIEEKWMVAQRGYKVEPGTPPPDWTQPTEMVPDDFPRDDEGEPLW